MLWNHCRGIDNRMVDAVQEMKSVGAEVNWGVRFNDLDECHYFLTNLCKEVSTRLKDAAVKGRTITLKVKKRKEGADEPIKYMGCGDCENMSRSMTVPAATDRTAYWENQASLLPPMSHLDMDVVKCLPPEIVSEMDELYQGRLSDIIEKHGNKKDLGNDNIPMPYAEMKGIELLEGIQRESLDDIVKETGNCTDHTCSSSASADKGKQPVFSSDVPLCKASSGSMVSLFSLTLICFFLFIGIFIR
ncbi:hypothetical protein Taro_044737 [Colocasia esculenta]|uniref:DNA repair protein REV1 n=1 Tax=Colocasia esculenta TaxID=4460 RepID=A0A843WUS5_COLES|nr:hypothetical protein [Colocasia esculenta]